MSYIDILVVEEAGSPNFKLFSIEDVNVEVTISGLEDGVYAFRSGNSFVVDTLENSLILKGGRIY